MNLSTKMPILFILTLFILACGTGGTVPGSNSGDVSGNWTEDPSITTLPNIGSETELNPAITPTSPSTLVMTPTPIPETETNNKEIIIALIGLIGVIAGGAITGFATIKVAKIQAQKK